MNNENLDVEILFFRSGKEYYITYDGKKYFATPISVNSIKSNLKLPYKVLFWSCPKSFIGRCISLLSDDMTDVSIHKLHNSLSGVSRCEAIFSNLKKNISVFEVPNKSTLYGRVNNCNPYILTNLNDKDILMEVTKDYAKDSSEKLYFLADDLTDNEKDFFDNKSEILEVDYIYKLDKRRNKVRRLKERKK